MLALGNVGHSRSGRYGRRTGLDIVAAISIAKIGNDPPPGIGAVVIMHVKPTKAGYDALVDTVISENDVRTIPFGVTVK